MAASQEYVNTVSTRSRRTEKRPKRLGVARVCAYAGAGGVVGASHTDTAATSLVLHVCMAVVTGPDQSFAKNISKEQIFLEINETSKNEKKCATLQRKIEKMGNFGAKKVPVFPLSPAFTPPLTPHLLARVLRRATTSYLYIIYKF